MTDERAVLRYVSWRDLFPWLIILRTFRIAISPTLLALATAGLLLSSLGWTASGWIFLPKEHVGDRWVVVKRAAPSLGDQIPPAVQEYLPAAATGLFEPFVALADPVRRLFQLRITIRETAYYVLGLLWSLAIWAFVGGVITRQAVVQLATEHPQPARAVLTFAGRRWAWYFLTPLYPLLGIALLSLPIALLGLLLHLPAGVGTVLVGLAWIFVILASLAATWLIAGLLFGWPLMWPAISAERDGDPFEAFSRSFSYVYGKPLHYLFFVVVAALFGALCLAVVHGAAQLVTEFGFWALAWGGGGERVSELRQLVTNIQSGMPAEVDEGPRAAWFGAQILALLIGLVRLVATAYTFSFFWCVASALYLLLRNVVDEQEIDEVYLEEARATAAASTKPVPELSEQPEPAPAETAPAASAPPEQP